MELGIGISASEAMQGQDGWIGNKYGKPGMVDERYRNVSSSTPCRESRVTYNVDETTLCRLYDHELGLEPLGRWSVAHHLLP